MKSKKGSQPDLDLFTREVLPVSSVKGMILVPGDKSISHRACIFSTLMKGKTKIKGLLESEDVMKTLKACEFLGNKFKKTGRDFHSSGLGMPLPGISEENIYLGNSGTSMRLLMGLFSGIENSRVTLTGDSSLSKRPMDRVAKPLSMFGAKVKTQDNGLPPVLITGRRLGPIQYFSPISSAQIKSALMLAALASQVPIIYGEKEKSREHTERMLRYLGISVKEKAFSKIKDLTLKEKKMVGSRSTKGFLYSMEPPYNIKNMPLIVPGDISSASYFLVLSTILPGSSLKIKNVGLNPSRTGIISAMQIMGANIEIIHNNKRYQTLAQIQDLGDGELIGDIEVKSHPTTGSTFYGEIIPNIIDEIPILAVLAAFSKGETVFEDVQELRVKESDRIESVCQNLKTCGIKVESWETGFKVFGSSKIPKGGKIKTNKDHRIAMAFSVLGLASQRGTLIDDASWISTSFPNFFDLIQKVSN